MRLIGHYQAGRDPVPELALRHGPLPRFDNVNIPGVVPKNKPPFGLSPNSLEPQATGSGLIRLPPLTPDKAAQYAALFEKSGAYGGILPGEQAKQIFERAGLPNEVLGKIWSLVDTEQKGALGSTEFVIAMHLLASFKTGQLRTLPKSLPFALYEAASRRSINRSTSASTAFSSLQKQPSGNSANRATYGSTSQLLPQVTGSGSSWLITHTDKAKFDTIFTSLDKSNRGYISGDEAVPFFSESKLPDDVLAQIWDLADINSSGRLSRDEFAVAMYLIREQKSRQDGRELLPTALPPNLVPPSMRDQHRSAPSVMPHDFGVSTPIIPRSAAEDLFGLDALSLPVTTAEKTILNNDKSALISPSPDINTLSSNSSPALTSPMQPPLIKPFTPSSSFGQSLTHQITGTPNIPNSSLTNELHGKAPSEDLLGDNDPEISKKLTSETDEVANLTNQVNTLSMQLKEVQDQKTSYQNELMQSSTQKRELETRLAQLRTLYNSELNEVRSLQERHSLSLSETKKVQVGVETLEISLQELKNDHRQVFEALQADQLENSRLKEQIRVVNSEISQLKPLLEKAMSNARQQKGMVEINKKLLSTTEAERDTLKHDLQELNKSIKEDPEISDTNFRQSVSVPAASFNSTTVNNNPFFRRKENPSEMNFPLIDAFSDDQQSKEFFKNTFGPSYESPSLNEKTTSKPGKQDTRSISVSSQSNIPVRTKSTDPSDIRAMSSLSPELMASQVLSNPPEISLLSSGTRSLSASQSFPAKLNSESPCSQAFAPAPESEDKILSSNPLNDMDNLSKSSCLHSSSAGEAISDKFNQNISTPAPALTIESNLLPGEPQSNIFSAPTCGSIISETPVTESFIFKASERTGSAKDDFDSAFAGFCSTAKSQERTNTGGSSGSGSAGGANIVGSHKEFPPITELSDDSDSTSEGVGFDDDFATACPGLLDNKKMTNIPAAGESKSADISSSTASSNTQSLASQVLPSPNTNDIQDYKYHSTRSESQSSKKNNNVSEPTSNDSAVFVSNPILPSQIHTKNSSVISHQTESFSGDSDDDFDDLEDAKEGDTDDEFANGSGNDQPNIDGPKSISNSPLPIKGVENQGQNIYRQHGNLSESTVQPVADALTKSS